MQKRGANLGGMHCQGRQRLNRQADFKKGRQERYVELEGQLVDERSRARGGGEREGAA